ncbi:MAG: nucleotidyl transferase AbiEii/AbiGii toxin family protein [Spirochaetia bacterium]|jgi:predicted nucleotidyltransferase component of viral defense system|nr:nucleotidyl transferase AbiEii/AbiGii toxin family protein [Spirochaetia bacterium]
MISKDEIIAVADETGLTPRIVEKDYVLGWLLGAVNANAALSQSWVFKGGTCLKKCYFETYRFSEDLDFTLQDEQHINEEFLKAQFAIISEWLYEAAGIEIPTNRFIFDIYKNPRGHQSCQGRVYYKSYFSSGKLSFPKIKFDLSADEILVLPPSRQEVFHTYTDSPQGGIYINSYVYPEVFGEKVRALGERGRPRDLYDVINLFRNDHLPTPAVIQDVLTQKCNYKKIDVPVLEDMESYKDDMLRNWEPMLAHQLPSLPPLEIYWDALPEFFEWLEGKDAIERPTLTAVSQSGQLYRPSYGHLGLRTLSGSSLEIIRFAAGNRLCVELDYTDNKGRRSNRVIEPYSLRRAQNGNILLYAVRAEDGQIRAYKINQINDASITNRIFVPRYQIELSPSGNLDITQRAMSRSSKKSSSLRRRTSSIYSSGPTFIYRCPLCDKTFRRKTQNPELNPHKTKDGWPCPGRTGHYEKNIY